jgi:hypothetical protein
MEKIVHALCSFVKRGVSTFISFVKEIYIPFIVLYNLYRYHPSETVFRLYSYKEINIGFNNFDDN